MRRRIRTFATVFVGLFLIALSAWASPTNVILLVSDDGGYAEYGFQEPFVGKTVGFKTPNLDQLAARGVVFSQGYVSGTVCSPSRAGFLSGRYQQRIGYEYNISNDNVWDDGMPTWIPMMQDRFKAAGYTTGCIGKWHVGSAPDHQPQNRNIDFFYGLWSGSRPYFQDGSAESDRTKRIKRNTTNIDWWTETSYNGIAPDTNGKGRHLTDAFGDEMAKFIANHANDPNGFFLYVPFTSPHGPYDKAKKQDMNQFPSFGTQKQKVAALIYAMDRAVGFMMDRLEDPNNDGNTSDSIMDRTAIAFFVDNGGANGDDYTHDNTPLRGNKSQAWEGGIRVPFFMNLPGVPSGVYTNPVVSLDATATLLAAAGLPQLPSADGVDLAPYLNGVNPGQPHEQLFWRQGGKWAIRKGNWKLCQGTAGAAVALYKLESDGSGEYADRQGAYPDIYEELLYDFTVWDMQNTKPRWSTSTPPQNVDDRFQFRPQDLASNWSVNQVWSNPDDSWARVNLTEEDAYANCVLQFPARDDMDYTANNNMTRQTGLPFALNEIRLVTSKSGAVDHSATITGNRLIMARSLANAPATINNASSVSGGMQFTFNIDVNLALLDDLTLTGGGNTTCNINGNISNYGPDGYAPARGLTKTGTSTFTLKGSNAYRGATTVNAGALTINGGSISRTSQITVGPQGAFNLQAGSVTTPQLTIDPAATFAFTGGRLTTPDIVGELVNAGGIFAPGLSPAITTVSSNYTQLAGGTLELEIGGARAGEEYDQLQTSGAVSLDGTLDILLTGGYTPRNPASFTLITAPAVTGTFSVTNLPPIASNLSWVVSYDSTHVMLQVVDPSDSDGDGLPDSWELDQFGNLAASRGGNDDYDEDGFVDAHEHRAGTDATNKFSLLQITGIHPLASNNYELNWSSISGKTYQLMMTTNVLSAWYIQQQSILATGTVQRVNITSATHRAWFRIDLQ